MDVTGSGAEAAGDLSDGEALCEDGEEDDDIGDAEELVAGHFGGQGEGEGYGEAAPKAAPGEDADGIFFEAGVVFKDADREGDGQVAGEEDDGNRCYTEPEEGGAIGDDEHFEADEEEEDGIEEVVDEAPEFINI